MFSPRSEPKPAPRPHAVNPTVPEAPKDGGKTSASSQRPAASVISGDLYITGNIKTTGDIQIHGTVEGDIRASMLQLGRNARVKGEIVAEDVIIEGTIEGRVRGEKVRLTSTARVTGDIVHKVIAIESGADFEGSVKREDDPLKAQTPAARPKTPAA